jgi:hypothetical protein
MALSGVRPYTPRGDKFAVAADAYLANHVDEWSERHRAGLKALIFGKLASRPRIRKLAYPLRTPSGGGSAPTRYRSKSPAIGRRKRD